jgi:hypothetical protein
VGIVILARGGQRSSIYLNLYLNSILKFKVVWTKTELSFASSCDLG